MDFAFLDDWNGVDLPPLSDYNIDEFDFVQNNQQSTSDLTEKCILQETSLPCFSFEDAQNPPINHEQDVSKFINQFSFPIDLFSSNEPSQEGSVQPNVMVKSTGIRNTPYFSASSENKVFSFNVQNSITVLQQPEQLQHVRYEKESEKTLRYNKASDGKPIRISLSSELSVLWEFCKANVCEAWLRITRTTVENSGVIARHPYPIWMKNKLTMAYDESLYKRITETDKINGYIEIKNLVLTILKQDNLEKIDNLAIYDPSKTICTDKYFIGLTSAKDKIERCHLHQSALHFQIMLANPTNILSSTDCYCKTIEMTEFTGSRPALDTNRKRRSSTQQSSSKAKKLAHT